MTVVPLVSGGLDSTVLSALVRQEGLQQFPLFIDYGQLNLEREREACFKNFSALGLPRPECVSLAGYGQFFRSGLTDRTKRLVEDAFLPGRNLLFLLCGAAYAYERNADAVAIGLLDERLSLFPDQTSSFLSEARGLLSLALGRRIDIIHPLSGMTKAEVIAVAKSLGISGTYSCHAGTPTPCGTCIACREYFGLEV